MKHHSILFSTPMIKAILAGRKTQTRRVIKGTPLEWLTDEFTPEFVASADNDLCPYGKPGDILWVREKHQVYKVLNDFIITYSDGTVQTFYYKQLSLNTIKRLNSRKSLNKDKWVTARFMPRELSRIALQITDIRAQRLQDISEEDAQAEGVDKDYYGYGSGKKEKDRISTYKHGFTTIWSNINGFDSWQDNPWVWAITFNVLSTTGQPENLKSQLINQQS